MKFIQLPPGKSQILLRSENGNVLFLILIAVALFAGLSYAVTQSQRGSGNDVTSEKLSMRASAMLQYATSVRAAVHRMVIFGVDPADLNFWWDSGLPTAVFSKAGGRVVSQKPGLTSDEALGGDVYNFLSIADNRSVKDIGTTKPDVIMMSQFKMNDSGKKLCSAINRTLGIETIPGSNSGPDWMIAADGRPTACAQNWTNFYIFYMVLVER